MLVRSEDLKIGDRFHDRIEESIRLYDNVMIVLSAASVRSRWVERDLTAAWERENRENRSVLFPIRIDEPSRTRHNRGRPTSAARGTPAISAVGRTTTRIRRVLRGFAIFESGRAGRRHKTRKPPSRGG